MIGGDDELQAADAQVGSAQHHLHAPGPHGLGGTREQGTGGEGRVRHGQLLLTLAMRSTISMHLSQCLNGIGRVGGGVGVYFYSPGMEVGMEVGQRQLMLSLALGCKVD